MALDREADGWERMGHRKGVESQGAMQVRGMFGYSGFLRNV